jgi:hypothetical protein
MAISSNNLQVSEAVKAIWMRALSPNQISACCVIAIAPKQAIANGEFGGELIHPLTDYFFDKIDSTRWRNSASL